VSVGDLQIVLPSNVDVQVDATVDIGNATVFGQRWSGLNQPEHSVFDAGDDGPGGGRLTITASVDIGDLGVQR
jgi:predicted membrane protein